jgi:methyl-galactoside transport system substrate-binding protein
MKRLLSFLLAATMVFGMTACGGAQSPPETPVDDAETAIEAVQPSGDARVVNVGVSIYKFDDNFMTLYREEIQRYFESLNSDEVTYDVTIMDGKGDMAEQTNQVDTFIAQGKDVMIINLVQASSAEVITSKAMAAGIPIVYINREPSEEDMQQWDMITYVGADARQSGTYQGEIIANLPSRGDADGDGVVRYAMIMGDPENVDAQFRTEYSIKALTDAGIEVENLFQQRGDWDQARGRELAANALAQFGDRMDVIFCNNDAMALGAFQAIQEAGRTVGENIYLVGVDALEEAVEMVRNGDMTGTVLNDHIGQSNAAVDAAIRFVNGEPVERYIWVNYQKVTH